MRPRAPDPPTTAPQSSRAHGPSAPADSQAHGLPSSWAPAPTTSCHEPPYPGAPGGNRGGRLAIGRSHNARDGSEIGHRRLPKGRNAFPKPAERSQWSATPPRDSESPEVTGPPPQPSPLSAIKRSQRVAQITPKDEVRPERAPLHPAAPGIRDSGHQLLTIDMRVIHVSVGPFTQKGDIKGRPIVPASARFAHSPVTGRHRSVFLSSARPQFGRQGDGGLPSGLRPRYCPPVRCHSLVTTRTRSRFPDRLTGIPRPESSTRLPEDGRPGLVSTPLPRRQY